MAQAVAQARPRKQRAQALAGAVEAIRQDAPDARGRLVLERRTLKHAIGLGQGRGTGLLGLAEMPEHAVTDNHGQIDLVGETAAMFLVGQEIGRQRETTPGQHSHHTVMAQCAH